MVQKLIYEVLETSMRLLNPILPFTMYEVNKYLPGRKVDNPTYLSYPTTVEVEEKLDELYSSFLKLRDDVLKVLENRRQEGVIGSSQEASLLLYVEDKTLSEALNKLDLKELARLFIVSKVTLVSASNGLEKGEVSYLSVKKHDGHKCLRCWNYEDASHMHEVDGEEVCDRCYEAIKNLEEQNDEK